ncbi:MAG: magnesium chelatase [Planctomycetota bacterium]|nr:magnesium chelatase [Planctomycetota bacterium]MEC9157730.1 magnesium chelatase [Planctomycetota bacterium]MEC9232502.1 magnesium chelatase [Planctomycetota bacterium]MED6307082.1 magnesium chelatase [Planctomycetota bacterium]
MPETMPETQTTSRPSTLAELRASGWRSRSVKAELQHNLVGALEEGRPLFPGIVGYDDTVVPEVVNGLLAGHDLLFLGEKGQAKSRLMRRLVGFLDEWTPYLDLPDCPVHEDPFHPITRDGKALVAGHPESEVPIAWWHRDDRYAERLAPGTKFADLIGEIDPAKVLSGGASLNTEDALSFGLIPRMHRGLFAMNELPDLDDLVQVGLFNILEERDVQIRGYPVSFDIDVCVLFSANPATYNRSGKVIPQLKDRIGTTVVTHYPRERELGMQITREQAIEDGILELDDRFPVVVPRFMAEVVEQMAIQARASKWVDQDSGVSARFSIANYKTMVSSARRRAILLADQGEPTPAIPRISDLGHFHSSAIGKLELDMMGTHQMSESQVLDAILAEAVAQVFGEYVDQHGLEEISEIFGQGVRVEVGDQLPSAHYAELLKQVPPAWAKAFEVNAAEDAAVRASCVEFVLAGLWATDRISRGERFGKVQYVL